MSKSAIVLNTVVAIFEFVLLVALVWTFALADVASKWTCFCVGVGSGELLLCIAKNVVELCKKE